MKLPHLQQHGRGLRSNEALPLQFGGIKPPAASSYYASGHCNGKALLKSTALRPALELGLPFRATWKFTYRSLAASVSDFSPSLDFLQENGDSDDESDNDTQDGGLSYFRCLVLDTSYRPVHVVGWKRAICLEFLQKGEALVYYNQRVSSVGGSFYIPAVLKVSYLVKMRKRRKKVHFNRKNIFGRDLFTCQYCRSNKDLTIDHVLPVSRGGKWTWENLVTACADCNTKKGSKTLLEAEMKLIRMPKAPTDYDTWGLPLTSATFKALRLNKTLPREWSDFLSSRMFIL